MTFLSYVRVQIQRLDKHLESCSKTAKEMRSEDRHDSSAFLDESVHNTDIHNSMVEGEFSPIPPQSSTWK